jgi:hypothetical protein
MIEDFRLSVTIPASRDRVWQRLVDWKAQGEWMLMTRVTASDLGSDDSGIGTTIDAFTGIGRFGLLDRMKVTEWQPPIFCAVEHYGKWIKGVGEFHLVELDDQGDGPKVRFDWYERIDAPRIILALIKPGVLFGVFISLRRFARSFTADGATE